VGESRGKHIPLRRPARIGKKFSTAGEFAYGGGISLDFTPKKKVAPAAPAGLKTLYRIDKSNR